MAKRLSWLLVFVIFLLGLLAPLSWVVWQAFAGIFARSSSLDISPLWEMLKFTLLQSFVSGAVSVFMGGVLAFYYAGNNLPFRGLVKKISLIPYSFPTVVVAVAFILTFGRSGWIGQWFGEHTSLMYNTPAIVAAHVFMNAPLVFSTLLLAMESLPQVYDRQAQILALSHYDRWRYWVWPELRYDIFGLFLTISLICFSSFSIVLILGGSPQLATFEVGIYSAIKSEGNFESASLLCLLQIIGSAPLILLLKRLVPKQKNSLAVRSIHSLKGEGLPLSKSDKSMFYLLLFLYLSILVPPLLAILVDGLQGLLERGDSTEASVLLDAFSGSLKLSFISSLVSVLSAWIYARVVIDLRERFPGLSGMLQEVPWFMLLLSPALTGVFWLFVTIKTSSVLGDGYFMYLILAHFIMTFPIVYRMIYPALDRLVVRYHRPIALLNMSSKVRILAIEWHELKLCLLSAWGVAIAFSVSEVATVLLVSGGGYRTLATLVFESMGSYKFGFAATVALIIGIISVLWAYFYEVLRAKENRDVHGN